MVSSRQTVAVIDSFGCHNNQSVLLIIKNYITVEFFVNRLHMYYVLFKSGLLFVLFLLMTPIIVK